VQLAEISLANVVVHVVQVEVIWAAMNMNMILDGKMDRVTLVCPAAGAILNLCQAVAKVVPEMVVLEMKTGGCLEVGESDDGSD
jgi:hypothetical protein